MSDNGKTSLRERKKHRTRVDIVRAAVELFESQGFDATTVDEIVEAADYSRSTFFRYFTAKEDVVFGDLPEQLDGLREATLSLKLGDDPWVVRDWLARLVPSFMSIDRELEASCVRLWFTEPALRRRYAEVIIDWERVVAEVFARCWGVDAEAIECQVVAASLIAAGRIAVRQSVEARQAGHDEAIERALKAGFDLLDQGFDALRDRGALGAEEKK